MVIYPPDFPSQAHIDAYTTFRGMSSGLAGVLNSGSAKEATWQWIIDAIEMNAVAAIVAWDDGTYSLETIKNQTFTGGHGGTWSDICWDGSAYNESHGFTRFETELVNVAPGFIPGTYNNNLMSPWLTPDVLGGHSQSGWITEWDFANLTLTQTCKTGGGAVADEVYQGVVVGFRRTVPSVIHTSMITWTYDSWSNGTYRNRDKYTSGVSGIDYDIATHFGEPGSFDVDEERKRAQISIDLRDISLNTFFNRIYEKVLANLDGDGHSAASNARNGVYNTITSEFPGYVITPISATIVENKTGGVDCVFHQCVDDAGWIAAQADGATTGGMGAAPIARYRCAVTDSIEICGSFGLSQKRFLLHPLYKNLTRDTYSGFVSAGSPLIRDVKFRIAEIFGGSDGNVQTAADLVWIGDALGLPSQNRAKQNDDVDTTLADFETMRDDPNRDESAFQAVQMDLVNKVDVNRDIQGVLKGPGSIRVKSRIMDLIKAAID